MKARVYQAKSGQWAWVLSDEDGEYCRGGGYASEEDAIAGMYAAARPGDEIELAERANAN